MAHPPVFVVIVLSAGGVQVVGGGAIWDGGDVRLN
jgi:hypothetical protein